MQIHKNILDEKHEITSELNRPKNSSYTTKNSLPMALLL